jgi:hypothetical protein
MSGPRAYERDYTSASGSAVAVTPNDGTDLVNTSRAIYVGVSGNIAVILDKDSSSVIFVGAQAGSVLPIRVKRVLATGTTATSLVALY